MKVLNRYHGNIPDGAIGIMRPGIYGNPFRIGEDGDRDEVIRKHMEYAEDRIATDPAFRNAVAALYGHDLVCCCAPKPCHGDNLVILAERLHAEETAAKT